MLFLPPFGISMGKSRELKILFHLPNPDTIYAGRTIFFGYKHAFEDLGHEFKTLTPDVNQGQLFEEYEPDIFITGISSLVFKFLDLNLVKKQKEKGMKVFVSTPLWKSPISKLRINETQSLSEKEEWIKLIQSGNFGDVYYNICEQGDPYMDGFIKTTGYKLHTILLAADRRMYFPDYSKKFEADISYIGTYLPGKKKMLDEQVRPLSKKYKVKLYGQDWTLADRILGMIQRGGQYFNIPYIKSFLRQPLQLEDERRIYTSSLISINIHEDYQKNYLGDINERTFKIPLAGGFEIVDDVPSIKKYFALGKEMIVAENKKDWFDKIDYYIRNPDKRNVIIDAGRQKVMNGHTYHNRVEQIINIKK